MLSLRLTSSPLPSSHSTLTDISHWGAARGILGILCCKRSGEAVTSSGHSNYEGSKGGREMIWCRRKIDKQVQVFQSDEQSLYHVQNMKWGVILIQCYWCDHKGLVRLTCHFPVVKCWCFHNFVGTNIYVLLGFISLWSVQLLKWNKEVFFGLSQWTEEREREGI